MLKAFKSEKFSLFRRIKYAKIVLLLFLSLYLFSCSSNLKNESDENIYKAGYDSGKVEFVEVLKDEENIYIKSKNRNKYNYLFGDIANIDGGKKIDKRIFNNKIIKLKNYKEYDNFSELIKNKNISKIEIIENKKWSKIINPILEEAILNMVPKVENQAIILSVANDDYVISYDKNNIINFQKLEYFRNDLKIIKAYNEKDFYNIVGKKIKNALKANNIYKDNLVIFELKDTVDADSKYILLDINNNMQYYFDFSTIFKTKEFINNYDYYLQIFFNGVIKSHIIEPIKSPITTIKKGSTFAYQGVKKTLQNKKIYNLKEIPPLNTSGEMMNISNFEKELDEVVGDEKYKGSMEYLIGGSSFFTDLINEIKNTQDEIFIRLYIYSNDDYGIRISNILKNKDKEGVDVRVLTSGLANNVESMKKSDIEYDKNFKQPKSIGRYLRSDSGISFRTANETFFTFDHSKMIVLDEKIAYVGGMNIGQPYRYTWHDMMIKLQGPIVYKIHGDFNKAWAASGISGDLGMFTTFLLNKKEPSKELQEYYENINKDKQIDIRILYTKPQNKTIYKAQLLAIRNAKKRIYIQNPYLADYKIINELIKARGRGVDVRIILPSENNVGMMGASNLVSTNIFLKNDIKVYKYIGMTHIKAAIYDGWATLGSANFDNLSLMINEEFNIAFSDPYYVEKLKEDLFDMDFKLSQEITKPYSVNWYDKVLSVIANRF